jgi:nitrate/nitrite transporter NarK
MTFITGTDTGEAAALPRGSVAHKARPAAATAQAPPRRWAALAVLAAADFVVILDSSIVNVALPSVGRALHLSQGGLSWVINAYVLTFGGFLLLGGRMADLFGRRRVFMTSLVAFCLASLAGGLVTHRRGFGRCARGPGPGRGLPRTVGAFDRDEPVQ